MKYSNQEIAARKQVAMSAANFYVTAGFRHVTMSITTTHAEVTLFLDKRDELEEAIQMSKPFMLDGTSRESDKGTTSVGDNYYYLTLEWL